MLISRDSLMSFHADIDALQSSGLSPCRAGGKYLQCGMRVVCFSDEYGGGAAQRPPAWSYLSLGMEEREKGKSHFICCVPVRAGCA